MKRVTLAVWFAVVTLEVFGAQPLGAQDKPIVIAAHTVLDGRGGILRDTHIVVQKGKIVKIDPKAQPVDYDLRALTVMPGWIDAHVHITSHFGANGRLAVD